MSIITIHNSRIELAKEPNLIGDDIIRVLAYFDMFDYPLTAGQLRQLVTLPIAKCELDDCLQQMVESKVIFRLADFYSLRNDASLAIRRKDGNERAEKLLVKAISVGKLLYRFPYVRAVAISGSLSKDFADEKADIDFFIITASNRLWLARTILHLFKKSTFLIGKQNYYCMNYFVDEGSLLIEDQNVFTAIEIKTVLPVLGQLTMERFFAANEWSDQFFPFLEPRRQSGAQAPDNWTKKFFEFIFNNKIGNWLDDAFLSLTRSRWQRKERRGKRNEKGLVMELIVGKHSARSNPGSFQEKILFLYQQKLADLNLS